MARAIETPWRVLHCPNCGRRLAEMRGSIVLKCRSCNANLTIESTGEYLTVQACLTKART